MGHLSHGRFLIARQLNVERALEMLQKVLHWRQQHGRLDKLGVPPEGSGESQGLNKLGAGYYTPHKGILQHIEKALSLQT